MNTGLAINSNTITEREKTSDVGLNIFLIIYLNLIIWAPYFDYLVPIQILGYSAFNTVIPTIGLFGIYLFQIKRYSAIELMISFLVVLLFLFCYLLQRLLGIFEGNLLKYYVYNRYVFNILFGVLIIKHLNLLPFRWGYYLSLLGSFLFANITSILFLAGLPTFRIVKEDLTIYEVGRFGGIWGAANGFAYLMALLCFALIAIGRLPFLLKLGIYLLGFFGWIAAGSRLCALFYVLLFPLVFIPLKSSKNIASKYLIILVVSALVFVTALFTTQLGSQLIDLGGAFDRMVSQEAGEDIRFQKNSYFLGVLFESIQNFMLGIKAEDMIADYIEFSDNGILLFMLNMGVPYFLIFFLFIIGLTYTGLLRPNFSNPVFWLLLIIIGITFFVNNATIWDNYIFVAILIVFLYSRFVESGNNTTETTLMV